MEVLTNVGPSIIFFLYHSGYYNEDFNVCGGVFESLFFLNVFKTFHVNIPCRKKFIPRQNHPCVNML